MTVIAPPTGCTWGRYVDELCEAHGGLTALTDLLIRRAPASTRLPDDPGSIERALRRLRAKGNAPGGQYGRWLLKYFGVPRGLAETARWMGQYHGRFSDLPLSLRESQLLLWDRPPIAESALSTWIHLGLAGVALARGDLEHASSRLARAKARRLEPSAAVEAAMLEARLESDRGHAPSVGDALEAASKAIEHLPVGLDRSCYQARLNDQLAYALAHETPPKLVEARELYASIDSTTDSAFVQFRRNHGLAYCEWKLGRKKQAIAASRAALAHAGDTGMLRFREQALRLLAHLVPRESASLKRRAKAIARELNR